VFDTLGSVGTWHDPDLGRPIAAPLERCAQLLGVDLATVRELAAAIEPYRRADGTEVWSLMQLAHAMVNARPVRPLRLLGEPPQAPRRLNLSFAVDVLPDALVAQREVDA
jgi:hypothetical protein